MDSQEPELSLNELCKEEAKRHALESLPNESCGLIAGDKYWRCRNVSENPELDFELHPRDYVAASLYGGKIQAIVHSHPKGGGPSDFDKQNQENSKKTWCIYSVPDDIWHFL